MTIPFRFTSTSGFVISNVGIVFVGEVRSGEAKVGDRLFVVGGDAKFNGKVRVIECERKPIESTVEDKEIGILIEDISDSRFNDLLTLGLRLDPGQDMPHSYDPIAEFAERGLVFPVTVSNLDDPKDTA